MNIFGCLVRPVPRPDKPRNCSVLPYSPELNPLENLWHYLKSHYWSDRAYANHTGLETAAIAAWKTAVLLTLA